MADQSVIDLTSANALNDEDLLVVFQNGETKNIAGSAILDYIEPSVEAAEAAAESAAEDAASISAAATTAEANALKAEGYAVGTQNGGPGDGSYTNINAKHYSEAAADSASAAASSASGASASALVAEGNALGTQNGTPVSSGGYFHNNAAYYAGVAQTESAKLVDYNDMAYRAYNAYAKKVVSGDNVVYFNDGAHEMPVDNFVIDFVPSLSSNATPTPTAPVTITGYQAVTIYVKDDDGTTQGTYAIPFEKNGTTYTVYYGTLNVVSGELTITHKLRTFTGAESSWNYGSSTGSFSISAASGTIAASSLAQDSTGFCSHYNLLYNMDSASDFTGSNNVLVYALTGSSFGKGTFIRDERFTDSTLYPTSQDKIDAFKAFLATEYNNGHPVQHIYRLATPTVVTLAPTEVKSLLGANAISVSAGTIKNIIYSVSPNIQNNKIEDAVVWMSASGETSATVYDAIGNIKTKGWMAYLEPIIPKASVDAESVIGSTSITFSRKDGNNQNEITYTVQISDGSGNPVYAGYYDSNTGYLTVTHKKVIYSGSSGESWIQSTAMSGSKYVYVIKTPSDCIGSSTDAEESTGWTNSYYNFIYNSGSIDLVRKDRSVIYGLNTVWTNRVAVYVEDCNTVQDFKDYIQSHNLHLVYRLATPVSVFVGKLEDNIFSLDEINVFSCDASSFSLMYAAKPNSKVVVPQMYGAVGDGVTDDTAAFQLAINSKKDVYVPTANREVYRITDTLVLKKTGQRIFGDAPWGGNGYVLLDLSGKSLTTQQLNDYPLFSVANWEMCHFSNLKFMATPTRKGTLIDASTHDADTDIRIEGCMVVYFYSVTNFRGRGFELLNSTIASGTKIGTFNWNNGTYVAGKGTTNGTYTPADPSTTPPTPEKNENGTETNNNNMPPYGQRAITIANNRIHSMMGGIEIASGHAYGLSIRNNTMDHGRGFVITAADEAWNWNITGNVFNSLYKRTGQVAPIYFAAGAKHCNITGNIIASPDDYWSVTAYYKDSDFKYWNVDDSIHSVDNFIKCVGAFADGVISANTFHNSQESCIAIDTITGSAISGNVFHNPGNADSGENPAAGAIALNGVSSRAAIMGNTFIFTETRNGVNPNVTFILAESGTELNDSTVYGNAHGASDSGMAGIISGSTNLKTDEIA